MTDIVIKDGTGTGVRAAVFGSNQLSVKATCETEIEYASEELGQAFILSSLENSLVAANGEYHTLWFRNNDPNKIFHINQIFVSTNGGSTTGNKVITGRLRIGSSKPSANNTATTGANLNLTSTNIALAEGYFWNGTGTGMTVAVPGPIALSGYFRQGFTSILFEGAFIVGYNNILDFTLQAAEDGVASVVISGWYNNPAND